MKSISRIVTILLTIVCFFFADTALAGRVAKRQANQQKRVEQGIASGEITKEECLYLEHQQNKLQRVKNKALSDGKVTKKEKIRLERLQDKNSRQIYRAKHNEDSVE